MDLNFLKSTHKMIEEHGYSTMSDLIIYHGLSYAVDKENDDLLEYAIEKIYEVWFKNESTNLIELSDEVAFAIINAKSKEEEFKAVDSTLEKFSEGDRI